MADDPKLVVAISARLDQFEKQLKEAGVIAEREVSKIETKMSTIAGGVAIGSILAKAIEKAMQAAVEEIEKVVDKMLSLGAAAKKTGLDIETIQRVAGAAMMGGVPQAEAVSGLTAAAQKMDEMNRHTTQLSQFLDANNIKYREQSGHVVNIDKGLELAAQLMARAGSEFEKIEIAKMFGLTEKWVAALGQGVDHFRELKGSVPTAELQVATQHMEVLARLANFIKTEFVNWGTNLVVHVLPALEAIVGFLHGIVLALSRVTVGGPLEQFATELENRWGKIHALIKSAQIEAGKTRVEVFPKTSGNVFGTGGGAGERDALTRAEDQLRRRTALLHEQARTVAMSTFEQEKARAATELLTAAQRAGIPVTDQMRAKFETLAVTYGDAAEKAKVAQAAFQETIANSKEFGSVLAEAFKGATLEGKKLDEVLKNLVNRLSSRAIDKMFDLFFAPTPGVGGSSIFTKLLQSGFSGRQSGGPVSSGTPYMVGEKGPELFVPNRGGIIVPNSATRGGAAAVKQTVVVNDYSGQAKVRQTNTAEGGGVEVFVPAIEQMLAVGVSRGRGALSKSVDARRRGTNLYG